MIPSFYRVVTLLAMVTLISGFGCVARPLPIPPTLDAEVDPEHIKIEAMDSGPQLVMQITGQPGAIDPPGTVIRVTYVGADAPLSFDEITSDPDGSFTVTIEGSLSGIYYFEAIFEEDDLYLISFQTDFTGTVTVVDPGPDSDDDGSPDAIDCAPDDDTVGGQRCE